MPISYDPSQLTPNKPHGLPTAWHTAAEQTAEESEGYVPFEAHEHGYVAKVEAAVDRMRPDAATRLLLDQPRIFRASMDSALTALQSTKQAARRAKSSTFLGPRSDLPSPERLASEMVGVTKTIHRHNMVGEVVNHHAKAIGAKTAEKDALVEVIIADLEHRDIPGDEAYVSGALERSRRAQEWTAQRDNLASFYPTDDPRALRVLQAYSTVDPGGYPPPAMPKDEEGNPDLVKASLVLAEGKIEDVASESQQLMRAAISEGCPQVKLPCVQDEDIDDRICAATNAIQIRLLGEEGLIFDAAERSRGRFREGTLSVGENTQLQQSLYRGAGLTYSTSLQVVPTYTRQQIYSALGFTADLSGNIASYRAFAELADSLNAYSAALCKGPECGRTAWGRVRISIRRVRSQIAMVVSEHTVLAVADMVRHYNAEAEFLGQLAANVFSRSASPTACLDVLPAVRALLPEQARNLDLATLTALAEAWQKIMDLVSAGEDADPDTYTVSEAQDAAALIRPGPIG